ncbi:hypothetical protein [Paenibacillus sp. GbtcB18]|uniref:hypothetical protein n=1 Tax=Paenibacillus sp. GbtcB18 TaxID=2824763 RepID=UPI001C2F51AA|nr:hypothetical protein [Paenibacillus sp. GbtcB18]
MGEVPANRAAERKRGIETPANDQVVSAVLNQGAVLIANRDSARGAWEAFVLTAAP